MVVFPPCKINIGLHVLNKREDGFHNIETVFYPVNIKDALEVISNTAHDSTDIIFTSSGSAVAGSEEDNLCVKAYRILKKSFPQLPNVKMHLHKAIPMGAGLGGGSADGAFTLKLLNEKFQLKLSQEELMKYALQLGSDCPFFINNKPCYATGRGEILKPVEMNLSRFHLVIVNPGIHVNTAWAFSQLTPKKPEISLLEKIQKPVEEWKEYITNDFEKGIFHQHPAIEEIKNILYDKGAVYASMSGSGSSVYGLFEKIVELDFHFPEHYKVIYSHL